MYNEGVPWSKKGASNFDIGQGSYDGAECAELVGLLLLSEVAKIDRLNVGLYRDDGLAVSTASRRQNENISKKISEIFSRFNLKITSEANQKRVDFLDVIFDLDDETFEPFTKPQNIPQYVNKLSNHPPAVIKNIPESVNKRLSSISSSEKMFLRAEDDVFSLLVLSDQQRET